METVIQPPMPRTIDEPVRNKRRRAVPVVDEDNVIDDIDISVDEEQIACNVEKQTVTKQKDSKKILEAVENGTNKVCDTFDSGYKVIDSKLDKMSSSISTETSKNSDLRNEISKVAHTLKDDVTNELQVVTDQVKITNERAVKSEHISFQVRGQLGAQERKRRKVDLEEIKRLKAENEVLKWKFIHIEGRLESIEETIVENSDRHHAEVAELSRQNTELLRQNNIIIALLRPTTE